MAFRKIEEIEAWKEARALNRQVFDLIVSGPGKVDSAWKDQINRAAGSIMDNIAEGFGRGGNKEFCQYLSFAKGSAIEVLSQLYRGLDRAYLSANEFHDLSDQTNKIAGQTTNLIRYLKVSPNKGPRFS